jgi:hypothetical protein
MRDRLSTATPKKAPRAGSSGADSRPDGRKTPGTEPTLNVRFLFQRGLTHAERHTRPGRPRKDSADRRADWPDDLCEIVCVDHFGNAMTGLRAAMLAGAGRLAAAGRVLERARTFSGLPPGAVFWYENSNGLAEIAVNQGRADRELGLSIGVPVEIVP